jgi:dTDP-4-amino-4,6-dideoxygalactose transaminase
VIPLFKVHVPPREHLMPALEKVIYSGYITQGAKVREFEEKLGAAFGVPNVLTVNSGTSALQLALRLANVRGGNVVTTPMTCSATVLPVLAEGARPVWADVDPDTGNIDPDDADRKINRDTKAILAVHWGGQPGDMSRLMSIAQHYSIPVIIDAAHALGAEWNGQGIAAQADFTCYSLQAIKHITTGDGGILVTRNADDYERGKRLRWFGIDRDAKGTGDERTENDIPEWGYKFHMNDITATMGITQLHYLNYVVGRHRDNAAYYDRNLSTDRQECPPEANGAWWLYTLLWEDSEMRARFMEYMKAQGIHVSRVHSRLDQLTCFRQYDNGDLPGVTSFYDRETCIPVHWGLTAGERAAVAESVNNFCAGVL